MKIACLTKEVADKLKEAAKKGEFEIAKMYEMTSEARRGLFEKHIDKDTAQFVNAEFEKAMVSNQQTALLDWAKKIFNVKEKKSARYKDILQKIDNLNEIGVLTPKDSGAFLEDLVASKLGITVTSEEAKTISEKANKLQELSKDTSEFNTPTIDWFKAKKEMDDYLDSLTPTSRLRVATETIGRGTLLASLKSPLLNIESNTVQGLTQAFQRRIETRRVGGVNNKYALKYINFVNQVYKESGFDISRMINLSGERFVRGEEKPTTQGPGKIRALGRVYEDLIFKKTQGAPDVAFSSVAFADRVNLETTRLASEQGLKGSQLSNKALEIFKDATSIEPKTPEGKAVRDNAIADAMYSTYTNKSAYSDFALGLRKLLNIPGGDLRVGDQIMPFVKTQANVIGAGVDASGIFTAPDIVIRMAKTIKAIHKGENVKEAFGENWSGFNRKVIAAGLGLTFAWLLSNLFKPDDFIGEYPTSEKERRLLDLKNATTNSVRIGNKWVSLDYFGPLGAPLVGMLYAKKYGKDLPSSVWEYYKGVAKQVTKIPGFQDFYDTVNSALNIAPGEGKTLSQEMTDIANYLVTFVRARAIPSILSDFAKGSDYAMRTVKKNDFIAGIKSGIPGLRQELPEKKTVLGEVMPTEGIISTLLFGERIKTAKDSKIVNELIRLDSKGQLPSLTDIERTNPRAQLLKEQIGEDGFIEAKGYYTGLNNNKIGKLIDSGKYKKMDDEEKKKAIEKIKDESLELMLKKYHYKKPKK